jgi:hypothetical protein
LDSEKFFSNPLEGKDGIYVLIFRNKLEARDRPFDDVRSAVESHYRRRQWLHLFGEHGRQVRRDLQKKLDYGLSQAVAAPSLGLQIQPTIQFTREQVPEEIGEDQLRAIRAAKAGEVTEFTYLRPDLRFFFIDGKLPGDIGLHREMLDSMERDNARSTAQILFHQMGEELIAREINGR